MPSVELTREVVAGAAVAVEVDHHVDAVDLLLEVALHALPRARHGGAAACCGTRPPALRASRGSRPRSACDAGSPFSGWTLRKSLTCCASRHSSGSMRPSISTAWASAPTAATSSAITQQLNRTILPILRVISEMRWIVRDKGWNQRKKSAGRRSTVLRDRRLPAWLSAGSRLVASPDVANAAARGNFSAPTVQSLHPLHPKRRDFVGERRHPHRHNAHSERCAYGTAHDGPSLAMS